jgi:hypothetical protein
MCSILVYSITEAAYVGYVRDTVYQDATHFILQRIVYILTI